MVLRAELTATSLNSSLQARCQAIWTKSFDLFTALPVFDDVALVQDAEVSVRIEGAVVHFKGRHRAVDTSMSISTASTLTACVAPVAPSVVSVEEQEVSVANQPIRRHFVHDSHLFTRAYLLGRGFRVILSVSQSSNVQSMSPSLLIQAYCPRNSKTSNFDINIDHLVAMIPQIRSRIYLPSELPSSFKHALTHWTSWFTPIVPCLEWTQEEVLALRYPSVYRACHVMQFKGVQFFRGLLSMHAWMDFSVQVKFFYVSSLEILETRISVAHLELLLPNYLAHVLERYRWPDLFGTIQRQLWLEYTTRGFELIVAGQTPRGRPIEHPAIKLATSEWAVFLRDEHEKLAATYGDCIRLTASVALRKKFNRQVIQAATTIQRVFRGHMGRMAYHQAVYEHAWRLNELGAMPGTRRGRNNRLGWFQDPHTLVAYGFNPQHPAITVACDHWILNWFDMERIVLVHADELIRSNVAAQCIQSYIRRWLRQRFWHLVYRSVVKLQYEFRRALRRQLRRHERDKHGISFKFARRIRHSWLLLHVFFQKTNDDDGKDVWRIKVAGIHPRTNVATEQIVTKEMLAHHGILSQGETMAHRDIATRLVDSIDLFYSAQSNLMAFRIIPNSGKELK
ncbi:hypothetical protein AeRB84_011036 [Aphanomyces euteiches]|nr:hypothetical protein AeRB84_011036 [Aphanomyces euteiches]